MKLTYQVCWVGKDQFVGGEGAEWVGMREAWKGQNRHVLIDMEAISAMATPRLGASWYRHHR